LCVDDLRREFGSRPKRKRVTPIEIERRWPGLLARSIADGLVPPRYAVTRP
jgi:hypothetical protein